jgi:hypothetical protein
MKLSWLLGLLVAVPASGAIHFSIENVDSPAAFVSLALDHQGNPHITYESRGELRYARKVAGTWTTEAITAGDFGGVALAIDNRGDAHIAYYDARQRLIRYVRRGHAPETVAAGDAAQGLAPAGHAHLAVDARGDPHVAYRLQTEDPTSARQMYATRASGVWTSEVAAHTGDSGVSGWLALDARGIPWISYWDLLNDYVFVANKGSGAWDVERVDFGKNLTPTFLALDARGRPQVCFNGIMQFVLLAARQNGQWIVETVASGALGALALDAQGRPHVAMQDDSGRLVLASKIGDAWTTEVVDADLGTRASAVALALDAQGRPHLAYVVGTQLRYATATR